MVEIGVALLLVGATLMVVEAHAPAGVIGGSCQLVVMWRGLQVRFRARCLRGVDLDVDRACMEPLEASYSTKKT